MKVIVWLIPPLIIKLIFPFNMWAIQICKAVRQFIG